MAWGQKTPQNPLRQALAPWSRAFLGVGLFSAVVNILMLTGPLFMLQVYDRVMSSGSATTLIMNASSVPIAAPLP